MTITRATKRPRLRSSPLGRGEYPVAKRFKRNAPPCRAVASVLALIMGYTLAVPLAVGQAFRYSSGLSVDETFTDNVNLVPRSDAKSDFVTSITPSLSVNETGNRLKLNGFISLPILIYARTGSENDKVLPEVSLQGTAEVVEKLLFIDSAIYVTQQYDSPFGARPQSLVTATNNRFTTESYTVSPYLRGAKGDYNYELRDNNIWTTTSGSGASVVTALYANEIVGTASRNPVPVGWTLDYDRSDIKYPDQQAFLTELERARAVWEADPQIEFSAGGGYEYNRFALTTYKGAIYNVGFRWRPTERTNVNAELEHRYFGASYHFAFDHRTPLSVWSLHASRDATTNPQQLATLPGGSSTSALLNQLLLLSIPDPVQRQTYIDQLIRNGSLPLLTSGPINLFTDQVLLQESETATLGLLGAHNSIFFSIFRLHSEPIAGSGMTLDGLLSAAANNTQTGGSIVWTHNLTPSLVLNTSGDFLRTIANAPDVGKTTQGDLRLTLTTPLSANTSAYAGARYQRLRSDVTTGYNEAAVYVGMSHIFR